MSRPLFTLEYQDSPFKHGWQQYEPPDHYNDCLIKVTDPRTGKPILVKTGGWNSAVSYPGIGNWIRFYEGIYVVTFKPESTCSIYFNIQSTSGESPYLVYETQGVTRFDPYWQEYLIALKGRNFHDGFWHSLVINLERDTKTCYNMDFQHLNWICVRGNVDIAEVIAIENQAELTKLWQELQSPLMVSAERIIHTSNEEHSLGEDDQNTQGQKMNLPPMEILSAARKAVPAMDSDFSDT